jgi:hypothetical protein
VVFILFGAVISSNFTQSIEGGNIPLASKGEIISLGQSGYAAKIINFSTRSLSESAPAAGIRISEIYKNPGNYINNDVKVTGKIIDFVNVPTYTYMKIDDGTGSLWVATQTDEQLNIQKGMELTMNGLMMGNFKSPTTNITYDLIIFTSLDAITEASASSGNYNVQSVQLEIYHDNDMIGSGTAEYLDSKTGSGTFPLVDSSITGTDVYVIFQGLSGGSVPITLKIIPGVNFAWFGIILFAIGIILIMAVRSR